MSFARVFALVFRSVCSDLRNAFLMFECEGYVWKAMAIEVIREGRLPRDSTPGAMS